MPKKTSISFTVHFYYGYGQNRECYRYKYSVDFDIDEFIEYLKEISEKALDDETIKHLYSMGYITIESAQSDTDFLEYLEEKYYDEARDEFRETEHELYEQLFDND